jgi:hypothetical protein
VLVNRSPCVVLEELLCGSDSRSVRGSRALGVL